MFDGLDGSFTAVACVCLWDCRNAHPGCTHASKYLRPRLDCCGAPTVLTFATSMYLSEYSSWVPLGDYVIPVLVKLSVQLSLHQTQVRKSLLSATHRTYPSTTPPRYKYCCTSHESDPPPGRLAFVISPLVVRDVLVCYHRRFCGMQHIENVARLPVHVKRRPLGLVCCYSLLTLYTDPNLLIYTTIITLPQTKYYSQYVLL